MIEIGLLVSLVTFAYWLGVRVGQEGVESGEELDARFNELSQLRDENERLRNAALRARTLIA